MTEVSALGTDVGGTFTDLVFIDPEGAITCIKVPSRPAEPGAGVLAGIDELRAEHSLPEGAWRNLSHTHSSTVATNALIERTGARVGLIVSAGFRDLFELQRLALPHPMRSDSRRPVPLVPRALVREVAGRMDADGREIEPLDEAGAVAAARALEAKGVEIIIVVFLHSYRNPRHEEAARNAIERAGGLPRVELSSEVWPQAREYERGVLTAINASVRRIVESYVDRLSGGLAERGIASAAMIARSNGGAELATSIRRRPVVALLSGPAAGVSGAAAEAADAGWHAADLMTLDVGGTSADLGVIRDGRPVLSSEEHIADFPLLIPTIAVSSIGAGGGSILWLDAAGTLKVGPRSVGADPGPACYGLSGSLVPALTDAFLVAGFLAPGQRLGGKLTLQREPAERALDAIGGRLGWTAEEVADGAVRVAVALMAAEASNVLARRGVDAPHFRMVAFGGAGPLVAALLALEIGIDAILIPRFPGGLSALGAARADLEGDLVQPVYRLVEELAANELKTLHHGLAAAASAWLAAQAAAAPLLASAQRLAADMRYDGQGYDVTVPLEPQWLDQGDHRAILAAFREAHRATYGHANDEAKVWFKELRVHVVGQMPKPASLAVRRGKGEGPSGEQRLRLGGKEVTAAVYAREDLAKANPIAGPAIVNQLDTTTLVPPGWSARAVASGALILERN
ncbi:MAG: hydantoinase/oxoprolinase family protein [Acetobacteraceae bacterium]